MVSWKSCFFIGHREANERLLPRLESVIERLITEENVRYFYVGGYGGFDQIAAMAVKHAKKKYPDITLMLALPYHPAERPIEKPPVMMGPIIRKAWRKRRDHLPS